MNQSFGATYKNQKKRKEKKVINDLGVLLRFVCASLDAFPFQLPGGPGPVTVIVTVTISDDASDTYFCTILHYNSSHGEL